MAEIQRAVDKAISIGDAAERAAAASKLLTELAAAQKTLKAARQAAVAELVTQGWTYEEIGKALGIGRARAFQIGQGMSGSTGKYYT